MPATDTRIDAYIAQSADFARPVLEHLRRLIHKGCPGVEETMKWSFPHFQYKGAILCSMAAFKQHCAFGFWKASLLKDPEGVLQIKDREAMGHLGNITSRKDLPSDKILLAFIKEAAILNEEKIRTVKKKAAPKKELPLPAALMAALKKNKKALAAFEAFAPSHRREYIEWITEAKTEETRDKRIATAIEWLAEGKSRHWKYQRK